MVCDAALVIGYPYFIQGLVGGKSRNLATLRAALPSTIAVPSSVALPFGTFERALEEPANATAAKNIAALQTKLVRWFAGTHHPDWSFT